MTENYERDTEAGEQPLISREMMDAWLARIATQEPSVADAVVNEMAVVLRDYAARMKCPAQEIALEILATHEERDALIVMYALYPEHQDDILDVLGSTPDAAAAGSAQ